MGRRTIIIVAVLAVVLVLTRIVGLYVDYLWFGSLGFEQVFVTRLTTQLGLFVGGGLIFLLFFGGNILLARRLARAAAGGRIYPASELVQSWEGLFRTALVVGGFFMAFTLAGGASAAWETVLRFFNGVPFGISDPLFEQDVAFYAFSLPLYRLVQGWLVVTLMVTLLAVVAVYAFRVILPQLPLDMSSEVPTMPPLSHMFSLLTRGIKAHASLLAALLAVLLAWGYRLDIYDLLLSPGGAAFGASYTDVHARWPALTILGGLSLLMGALLVMGVFQRGWRLPLLGVGLWLAGSILAGGVYPGLVQRFQVEPQELEREWPYIEHNIRMTRQAYALDRIAEVSLAGEEMVTPQEIASHPSTIRNIRLWDAEPLLDTYNQIQSIRLYYDFKGIDVDRYWVDGEYRQVMLSARELAPERLPAQAQTWVNRRLQFTHGYGIAMSPVNELTPEGLPTFFLQDVPPRGKLEVTRPEIYYGEKAEDYVIVRTRVEEFSYPMGDENVYTRYEGDVGVEIGGFLRRVLFAIHFGDINIILSDAIEPDSLILFHRNIRERMEKIAPFLTLDGDPYVVLADGQLYWIQDAYTTSDRYPYSQPYGGQQTRTLNYIRNSVKAVINAYDGSVTLYIAEPDDPIVKTWRNIFPVLFKPLDDMPESLRPHIRYPQDLFAVQADLYSTYHMRDPRVFYNKEDLWIVPQELYLDRTVTMVPYYIITRLPGEQHEEFVLIRPYTPPDKHNMITWLAARSDGENYGKLLSLRYPKDRLIFGPMQVEARIDQDPLISEQLTLWDQAGSRVLRGNMIVIPIGESNLYVEPIYLQSEAQRLPQMQRVVMASGNRVVMEPTVETSLARLFGMEAVVAVVDDVEDLPDLDDRPAVSLPTVAVSNEEALALLSALQERYSRIQQELNALENDLQRLPILLGLEVEEGGGGGGSGE